MQRAAVKFSAVAGRQFSSAASHQPPKKLHGINGRYAGAVYTAASKVRLQPMLSSRSLGTNSPIIGVFFCFFPNWPGERIREGGG